MRQIKNVENLVLGLMQVRLVNGEIKDIGAHAILGCHSIFPITCAKPNCNIYIFTDVGIWNFFLFKRNIEHYFQIISYLNSEKYKTLYRFKKDQSEFHITHILNLFKEAKIKIKFIKYEMLNFKNNIEQETKLHASVIIIFKSLLY